MRRSLITLTALCAFAFGLTASMAQTTSPMPRQMDPATIKVNPPASATQTPTQTQPAPIPQTNTSHNPYRTRPYLQTPVQPQKR